MRKTVSILLSISMLLSICATAVFAAHSGNHSTPGGATVGNAGVFAEVTNDADTDFYLIVDKESSSKQISATVPLWVCMYGYGKDGVVLTPSQENYKITNNSISNIKVTNVKATVSNGWSLAQIPTNSKELALSINGVSLLGSTDKLQNAWPISGSSSIKLPIEASIAANKNDSQTCTQVLKVTYTIAYDLVAE